MNAQPRKYQHNDFLFTLLGGGIGFALFTLTSHPRSPVHKRLPKRTIKNVSILPHIKFEHRERTYHFHHWINMLLLSLVMRRTKQGLLRSHVVHGFMLGGILQGLLYKDRFRIIYKQPVITEDIHVN